MVNVEGHLNSYSTEMNEFSVHSNMTILGHINKHINVVIISLHVFMLYQPLDLFFD